MPPAKEKPTYNFRSVTGDRQTHERIADQIRDAIFEKKLLPGEKLPTERDLAGIFNTSRVTVRSALLTLKNGGLLQIRQGKKGGAFVAEDIGEAEMSQLLRDIIGWKDICLDHVIEVRYIVEPRIAYLAARNADQEDMDNIWATIHELENLFKTRTKFRSSDENFHKALAAAAKNPLLTVFQASLMDVLFRFIYAVVWKNDHKERILQHHRRIAQKIQAKAPDEARDAMSEHLLDMQRILTELPSTQTVKWFKF
ncbi:MAG: FadR family transcriptional regulator [Deltaproteobacteria bacterium]|nr:FadR family transcriptional regulator [Deltaproteobacteria bacterium]